MMSMSVCQSYHSHNSTVARSSDVGIMIRYVLPVLLITSCFRTMGSIGGIEHDAMFRRVRKVAGQVEGRQLQCLVENGSLG